MREKKYLQKGMKKTVCPLYKLTKTVYNDILNISITKKLVAAERQEGRNHMDRIIEKAFFAYESLRREIASIRERDPAASSNLEVAMLYSGFHSVIAYRIAHKLHIHGYLLPARLISQTAKLLTQQKL